MKGSCLCWERRRCRAQAPGCCRRFQPGSTAGPLQNTRTQTPYPIKKPVLRIQIRTRIRIHRIHMFLGLLDPEPDPSCRGMDPDPDLDPLSPSKKSKKNLIPTALWLLFNFLSLKMMYMYLQKVISKKILSGSTPKCHGSATLKKTQLFQNFG